SRSFKRNGTPRNGPRGKSGAAAWARAFSKSGMMTALSFGLTRSMRAIAASTRAEGVISPRRTRSAWATASRKASLSSMRAPYDRPTFRHKKWYSRAMPILDARHNFAHPVEPDTAWSESYYFNAYDPTAAAGSDGQGRSGAGASAGTRQHVGKGHLEQAGRWSGWIDVDGARHELTRARGNRDKSWGPRRWGGPTMWRWFSVNVGDDVHFGGIRIGTGAGELHRGWVWRDGGFASIRAWDVRTELEADRLTHRVTHVRATDAQGRVHALRGDVLRVASLPQHGDRRTLLNEGLARWTYEGREGFGIAEYLHQLDADGRPAVPIE